MKKILTACCYSLFTALILAGSPVMAQFDSAYQALNLSMGDKEIEIIYEQEERPEHAVKVGEVKVKSNNNLMHCGIAEALSFAKTRAAESGGDAIYVKAITPPGKKPCYTIEADIYQLQEPYVSKRKEGLPGNIHSSTHEGYILTEILPEFPGGEKEMFNFIARYTLYPNSAERDNLKGKVWVTFVVSKTGKLEDIRIKEGVRYDLDQEVLRVISKMPEFVPGYQNGKAVPVLYTIPISFK